ncbi:MAG: carboxypeptidase regulatory-like domain-containing protein [Gammaproteobacteria bacterium]|jgi:hypothetical protein
MKTISGLPVVLLLVMVASGAAAADLTVRVFERGGKAPLPGAAVCLGTPANVSQFGGELTDAEGYVVFRGFPRAPLQVIASKSGYRGEQTPVVTSNTDRLLVLSLPKGGGGSKCRLGGSRVSVQTGGLQISRFALNNGAAATTGNTVTLNNSISGQPTHYRASENADFRGAEWQAWSAAPAFQLSAEPGNKLVYFQVRRQATIDGAGIETRSPVTHDSITLQ